MRTYIVGRYEPGVGSIGEPEIVEAQNETIAAEGVCAFPIVEGAIRATIVAEVSWFDGPVMRRKAFRRA